MSATEITNLEASYMPTAPATPPAHQVTAIDEPLNTPANTSIPFFPPAGFPGPVPIPGPVPAPAPIVTVPPTSVPAPATTPVTMTTPVAAPGLPVTTSTSPFANVPTWAWVLGGAALAGLIGFIIWSATRETMGAASRPNPLPAGYRRHRVKRRRRAGHGRRSR